MCHEGSQFEQHYDFWKSWRTTILGAGPSTSPWGPQDIETCQVANNCNVHGILILPGQTCICILKMVKKEEGLITSWRPSILHFLSKPVNGPDSTAEVNLYVCTSNNF